MLDERAWLAIFFLVYLKGTVGLRLGLCVVQLSCSIPKSSIHSLDWALCSGAQSHWNRKSLCKSWKDRTIKKMSQWAKTLTFPFTGTRKQPHSIILPPPTFTAGTVHSGRQCFLLFTKPRLNSVWCPDCQIEKRDEIYHCSTFPFLHSPAVACFTSLKPTLGLQGDAAAMATHTMKLPVLMLKSEDFENLQLLSQQSTGDF